ncbi:MAG: iron-containing alcohol dehydrogenase, partial [Candidatus Rokubacteria bacterium]|nr:iron-containing alcohol dehydrogenase [Candidatus Rokubacteria bacterium]
MTRAFQHFTPSKVVFAPAGLEPLGAELDTLGARRLFLVCGTTVRKSEAFELTRAALGSRLVDVFDEVVPHSSVEVVDAGVARLRAAAPDAVVSLGGGSAIDTAKAIVLLHAEGGTLEEHRIRFTPPDTIVYKTFTRPMLPHVALPTTFSGAEVNAGGGIRGHERHSKYVFSAPQLAPRVAVLATRLALGFPPDLLAGSDLICLAHGVVAL